MASYGRKSDMTFALCYGFLPPVTKERMAYSAIPLFPPALELDPDGEIKLDLLLKDNCEPLINAVQAAVVAETKGGTIKKEGLPILYDHVPHTPKEVRYRPCLEIATKIGTRNDPDMKLDHRATIEGNLPVFRAAASALAQIQDNHRKKIQSPIKLKQMVMAAGSKDPETDWNERALKLMYEGITTRLAELREEGITMEEWLAQRSVHYIEERELRGDFARTIRDTEVKVLESLKEAIIDMNVMTT